MSDQQLRRLIDQMLPILDEFIAMLRTHGLAGGVEDAMMWRATLKRGPTAEEISQIWHYAQAIGGQSGYLDIADRAYEAVAEQLRDRMLDLVVESRRTAG